MVLSEDYKDPSGLPGHLVTYGEGMVLGVMGIVSFLDLQIRFLNWCGIWVRLMPRKKNDFCPGRDG